MSNWTAGNGFALSACQAGFHELVSGGPDLVKGDHGLRLYPNERGPEVSRQASSKRQKVCLLDKVELSASRHVYAGSVQFAFRLSISSSIS